LADNANVASPSSVNRETDRLRVVVRGLGQLSWPLCIVLVGISVYVVAETVIAAARSEPWFWLAVGAVPSVVIASVTLIEKVRIRARRKDAT